MGQVISKDGTAIAYDRAGSGPGVVLVGGGAADRSENAGLATALAPRFDVVNYDRRGRGSSGDTAPYAVERELEDLEALIDVLGGTAGVFGASSGGALALEAAAAGLPIARVAVYEVPYNVDATWPPRWRAYVGELTALLAAGRRGDAFAHFMRLAEVPEPDIEAARAAPFWPALEALAPTLAYDAACLGSGQPPAGGPEQPVLVITGARRDTSEWERALGPAADALVAALPNATRAQLAGAGHVPDPEELAALLCAFFTPASGPAGPA